MLPISTAFKKDNPPGIVPNIKSSAGFSLIELIVVMAVMGVLAAMTSYGIDNMRKSMAYRAAARTVRGDFGYAKSRAIKERRQFRYVYTSTDGYELEIGNASRASTNWIKDDNPGLVREFTDFKGVTIDKGASLLPVFNSNGTLAGASQVIIKNEDGKSKTIRVSLTGRIRID